MKQLYTLLLTSLLLATVVFAQDQQQQQVDLTRIKYIKVDQENLRNAPNGKVLGQVLKDAPVVVIQENENWALIQFTAWVWKASLSNVKSDLLSGEYHALHILVDSQEAADDIMRQLKSGKKSFSDLAKERSIAPSASKGGDLGYFNKGDFPAELENAILGLKVGEVSGIVKTDIGYNIFKRIQ